MISENICIGKSDIGNIGIGTGTGKIEMGGIDTRTCIGKSDIGHIGTGIGTGKINTKAWYSIPV